MSTTQQPEALRDARWYMVNKDGMATRCTDRADAEKEAEDAQSVWPHMGPHRAVQLVEVADVEALRMGYAAARLEIESLQARIKTMAEEHADELMVAHLDGRMRAALDAAPAQPAPQQEAQDAAFEAVRKNLCALQRYSFCLDDDGVVRRVQDRTGNWIEFDDAHKLFDPVAVDAARKQGGA